MKEAFVEVLGWTHGVQFVCLAFQNSVASNIDGLTIHHWTGIPVGEAAGTSTTRDNHRFATRCQCLRFLLIDEISMVSAQLLGQLELIINKVIRRRNVYKIRDDGSSRPFGGLNVLLFGDWWQLKPVGGTALFTNPEMEGSGVALHGLRLMWGQPPNAVHRAWDFQQSLRCTDPWFNDVLNQCRQGRLSREAYDLLHGQPTAKPTEWGDKKCECVGECDEAGFFKPWVRAFLTEGRTAAELMATECKECCLQRARRKRVLDRGGTVPEELIKSPFDVAPALYSYNVPRYYTVLQRARQFARVNRLRLRWCFAKDVPLHREDRELTPEQLDEKRRNWLTFHDQQTSHLASQVPLVQGLPVRLTDAVDRERMLFRGRRGFIVGWTPHPMEEHMDVDGEWALTKLPQVIYVHFPGATWTVGADLGQGVYPLTPASRTFLVNRNTKVKARRTSFFLVPDFAYTAYMIQGQSLTAAFVDLVHGELLEKAEEELYVAAYVMLSRAKYLENLWILRPFGLSLFNRGPPSGPHLLMRKLRGELSVAEAEAELDKYTKSEVAEEMAKKRRTSSKEQQSKACMKETYRCTQCYLTGKKLYMLSPQAFGANTPEEVIHKIIPQGAWTRCLACEDIAASGTQRSAPRSDSACGTDSVLRCSKCQLTKPLTYFERTEVKSQPCDLSPQCRTCKGFQFCGTCQQWKVPLGFRTGSEVCRMCQPVQCAACGAWEKAEAYSSEVRRNYLTYQQNVVCEKCAAVGLTPKSGSHRAQGTDLRRCVECKKEKARVMFRILKGVNSEKCLSCEVVQCAACQKHVEASLF